MITGKITAKKCTGLKEDLSELEVRIDKVLINSFSERTRVHCFRLGADGSCNYNGECKYHPDMH